MPELNTVVVAIDGSDNDRSLLTLARHLGDHFDGARVFATHAVPPVDDMFAEVLFPYACLGDDREAIRDELMGHVRKKLRPTVASVLGEDRLRIGYGPTAATLQELNASLGPDLIVAGALGADRAIVLRLGHVVERLVAESPVAVLVARRALPIEITTIIVAIDLTASSRPVLEYALGLAHALGAKVTPVYVIPTTERADRASVCGQPSEMPDPVRSEVVRLQQQLLSQLEVSFKVVTDLAKLLNPFRVELGDPASVVLQVARELEATLIIAGKTSGPPEGTNVGRVASQLLRQSEAHTLLLPHELSEEA